MAKKRKVPYRITYMLRPGQTLSDAQFDKLVEKVRDAASTCFDEIPPYQIMLGTREEWSDKALALAWRKDGKVAGFCSAILLPVEGVGDVLHLGLTCVRPDDRKGGLTHLLTKKVVQSYLLWQSPFSPVWVTNCAAVLSSLGNVALHFDGIYPSPFMNTRPGATHFKIARAIDRKYREKIYIMPGAVFDPKSFVFKGSVKDTVFQKEAADARFHHREKGLNHYYQTLMNFGDGDEVLQVGHVSLLSAMRYALRRRKQQHNRLLENTLQEV